MDNFKIEIELGNAAMKNGGDVAAALRIIADQIDGEDFTRQNHGHVATCGRIRDLNGNTVGKWEVR
jgi:hypothetical protein